MMEEKNEMMVECYGKHELTVILIQSMGSTMKMIQKLFINPKLKLE